MSAVAPLAGITRPMTTAEFLAWEAEEEQRWEFDGVEPVAMTGAAVRHQIAVGNLRRALERQVPQGCRVFTETFKLRLPAYGGGERPVRYPDVLVTCEPLEGDDTETGSALVLAEVLLQTSARRDKVQKVEECARVPDLESNLIVDPVAHSVLLYRRTNSGVEQAEAGERLDLGRQLSVTTEELIEGVT